jgi:cyanate lyase
MAPACVGDRLRLAMLQYVRPDGRRGISWNELADSTKVGRRTIASILANKQDPYRRTLWTLAQCLDVDPAWLAGFRDTPARWPTHPPPPDALARPGARSGP